MINLNLHKTNYYKINLAQNFVVDCSVKYNLEKDCFCKNNISFEGKSKYTKKTLFDVLERAQARGVDFSEDEILKIEEIFETNPKSAISIIKTCTSRIIPYLKTSSSFKVDSAQGKLVWDDVDLVRKSVIEEQDINDLMVPKFETVEEGLKDLDIGDTFEVKDCKNIFIKTNDDSSRELQISKKAYCRLFPAIYRYSSGQQKSQDCYLVASLNSMMVNPKARVKLLSCFSENEDKSIVVKLPTSNTEVTIKENETIKDLGVKKSKYMSSVLGMQLLEYLYKLSLLENKTTKNSNNKNRTVEKIGGDGGYPEDVFAGFGFKDPVYIDFYKNEGAIDNLLLDFALSDDYIVTASITTKDEYEQSLKNVGVKKDNYTFEQKEFLDSLPTPAQIRKASLVSNHTYGICVQLNEDTQELCVIATNPWADITSKFKEVALSIDEFKKNFTDICVASVN